MNSSEGQQHTILDAHQEVLREIAICSIDAFPKSFGSLLGINFLAKTYEWYLNKDTRFLYYIAANNKVVGFCGGYITNFESTGSATAVTQYAFKQAIQAMLRKPWLVFNPLVFRNIRFIVRNVLHRLFKKRKSAPSPTKVETGSAESKALRCGLVVIGVNPENQGTGLGKLLQDEFKLRAAALHATECILTVKNTNAKALKSYERNGWTRNKVEETTTQMLLKL